MAIRGFVSAFAAACVMSTTAQYCSGQCAALEGYLAARQALHNAPEGARLDFSRAWLPALLDVRGDCGNGLSSARWHALSLSNYLEQWGTSIELAIEGRGAAATHAERAMWQEQAASAAFHARQRADRASILRAINELDAFLALAPRMESVIRQAAAPAWLIPSLNALRVKAVCQRELGDHLGAAATEQRSAAVLAAARIEPAHVAPGFLAEEAFFRASVDWARSNRPAEAAATLSMIRFLSPTARPAGQHAFNAIGELATDPPLALSVLEELMNQMGEDEWSILQAAQIASLVHNAGAAGQAHYERAARCVNRALSLGETGAARADAALRALQAAAGVGPEPDQDAGQYALLLRHRARLEMDAGDALAAAETIRTLRGRGVLQSWCDEAEGRLASRR